jgi:hypothetical protein
MQEILAHFFSHSHPYRLILCTGFSTSILFVSFLAYFSAFLSLREENSHSGPFNARSGRTAARMTNASNIGAAS